MTPWLSGRSRRIEEHWQKFLPWWTWMVVS